MDVFKHKVKQLTDEQINFISSEFGITSDQLFSMDEVQLSDLYDKLCDIEVEETMLHVDEELSTRGKIAEHIVTDWGNALAEANDWYEEDEEYDESMTLIELNRLIEWLKAQGYSSDKILECLNFISCTE